MEMHPETPEGKRLRYKLGTAKRKSKKKKDKTKRGSETMDFGERLAVLRKQVANMEHASIEEVELSNRMFMVIDAINSKEGNNTIVELEDLNLVHGAIFLVKYILERYS